MSLEEFRENDFYYDIETLPDGSICCLCIVNADNEDTHFMCSFSVDSDKVEERIRSGNWLKEVTGSRESIPPLQGNLSVESYSDEKSMLVAFKKKLDDLQVHCLTAWGADFDKSTTEKRCKLHDIYRIFEKIVVFDLMQSYSILEKNDSYRGRAALKFSCIDKMGYGKVEYNGERISADIEGFMTSDPELLACYNIWDGVLCRRLNDIKGNIIQFYRRQTDFTTCTIEDFYNNIKMIETIIMHRNYSVLRVLPSKHWAVYKGRIAGGFMMDPIAGLHKKVFELDLTKAYPTTIISGNYSTETYVEDPWTICNHGERCLTHIEDLKRQNCWECRRFVTDIDCIRVPSGRVYRKDVEGMFPMLLREMRDKRVEYQKQYKEVINKIAELERHGEYDRADALKSEKDRLFQMQFTMKSISNSFYGVLASPKFRLTNSEIAADVTHVVRNLVKWNIDRLDSTEMPFKGINVKVQPIYTDTDGVKCSITNVAEIEKHINRELNEDDIIKIGRMYESFLNDSYADFSEQTFGYRDAEFEVKLEDDKIMQSLYIWGKKKNYIYKEFPKGDRPSRVVKVGIKRSDRNKVFTDFTEIAGDMILDGRTKEIGGIIQEFEHEILSGKRDIQLGRPEGVGSDGNSFYNVMLYSNEVFGKEFKLGDKPVFYKVKGVKGKAAPPGKFVALEWGDDPGEFGIIIDRDQALDDLKQGVENFLAPIGTWDGLKSGLGTRDSVDDLW
jgi:DNA polymerase elongation subunit (family B)